MRAYEPYDRARAGLRLSAVSASHDDEDVSGNFRSYPEVGWALLSEAIRFGRELPELKEGSLGDDENDRDALSHILPQRTRTSTPAE